MIGRPTDSLLAVGKQVDFTIFDIVQVSEIVYDSYGNFLEIKEMFESRWVLLLNGLNTEFQNNPSHRRTS